MTTHKYALVATGSDNALLYYYESQTQGASMLRTAYSIAERFGSVSDARKRIPELSERYRGLSNWRAMRMID